MANRDSNQLLQAAVAAHGAHRLTDAARLYQNVLVYDPDNVVALSSFGLLLAELKQPERADAALRRALQLAPKYADGHINLAIALHDRQRFDESIASCERALKLAPGNKRAQNVLASSLTAAGRYDEAIALLERIIAARPGYAMGSYNIGTIYVKLGRPDEAVKHFRRATEVNPRDAASFVAAGECLLATGDAAQALAQFDRALNLKSYDVRALALKTLTLAELGRQDEERWLADPYRLVRTHRLAELGYSADDVGALNRRLSAFASNEPSLHEDPPEYATYKAAHSTTNLAESGNDAIDELKKFIAYVFEQRVAALAEEDPVHPFVRSVPQRYGIDMWAVRMRSGSHMLSHIHADGWLSAVYYVDVPSIVNDPTAAEAGWLKVGTPRGDIRLSREPITRTVRPEPGLMISFPSYLWHDTVPLPVGNDEQRLCLAFDLQPVK